MVSANFLLDFCWSVMNNQIASNRDLKIIAQKSQLSDKTKKMSLIVKRNRLSSAKCKRLAVRQFLSVEHRNHRLHFAQDHVNCHLHPIQRVLWRFWLDFNDGLRRIWREKMSNSTAAVLLSTTGLMVGQSWFGQISVTTVPNTSVIRNGSLTSVRYRDDILAQIVRPYSDAIWWQFHFDGWKCKIPQCGSGSISIWMRKNWDNG